MKKKLYLRSGSQRHRHFLGFFNVPVADHPDTGPPFLNGYSESPFTTRWGYEGRILDLNPRRPHGGRWIERRSYFIREKAILLRICEVI